MPEIKVRVRYVGPPQQVCYALSEHGYKAACVKDAVYSLPEGVATSLVTGSALWEYVATRNIDKSSKS